MHRLSSIAAGVLVLAMLAILPGTQAWAVPAAQVEHHHAAGCHGEQPLTPSPVPADYRCCVSGHHWAIPGAAFSGADVAICVGGDCIADIALDSIFSLHPVVVIVPDFSPPGSTQLRI
jgi:hypothetical protein